MESQSTLQTPYLENKDEYDQLIAKDDDRDNSRFKLTET